MTAELAEELRAYTAMKYAGDCKCGKCQLVPRDLVERIYHTLNGHPAHRKQKRPCPGCDGHECDDGCQYPGATPTEALRKNGDGCQLCPECQEVLDADGSCGYCAHVHRAPAQGRVVSPQSAEELDAILNSGSNALCTVHPDGSVTTDDTCQCPKCGRMHRRLGNPPASIAAPAEAAGEAWSATKHDKIIKRLMEGVGMPNSMSLHGAFKQFANELHALAHAAPSAQSGQKISDERLPKVGATFPLWLLAAVKESLFCCTEDPDLDHAHRVLFAIDAALASRAHSPAATASADDIAAVMWEGDHDGRWDEWGDGQDESRQIYRSNIETVMRHFNVTAKPASPTQSGGADGR